MRKRIRMGGKKRDRNSIVGSLAAGGIVTPCSKVQNCFGLYMHDSTSVVQPYHMTYDFHMKHTCIATSYLCFTLAAIMKYRQVNSYAEITRLYSVNHHALQVLQFTLLHTTPSITSLRSGSIYPATICSYRPGVVLIWH